jgi:hypothetical protein
MRVAELDVSSLVLRARPIDQCRHAWRSASPRESLGSLLRPSLCESDAYKAWTSCLRSVQSGWLSCRVRENNPFGDEVMNGTLTTRTTAARRSRSAAAVLFPLRPHVSFGRRPSTDGAILTSAGQSEYALRVGGIGSRCEPTDREFTLTLYYLQPPWPVMARGSDCLRPPVN